MKLFTVGPVEMDPETRKMGSCYLPYFRTPDFSEFLLTLEQKILQATDAPSGTRAVVLTTSGSGAMEAAVASVFDERDRLLVINGGTFGQRFADICGIHGIPFDELAVPFSKDLEPQDLAPFAGAGYTGLLVQAHETSIGKRFDLGMLGRWCRENDVLLVADCVSAFLTDEVSMTDQFIDVFITASQKALALPPGLAPVCCSERVLRERLYDPARSTPSLYLDLTAAFKNAERGQTPFTPALTLIYQLDEKLQRVSDAGGASEAVRDCGVKAAYFRKEVLRRTPFTIPDFQLSNGLTPLLTGRLHAHRFFLDLMEQYEQVVTPCGGEHAERLIRVGHMGHLHRKDFDQLIDCMLEVISKQNSKA